MIARRSREKSPLGLPAGRGHRITSFARAAVLDRSRAVKNALGLAVRFSNMLGGFCLTSEQNEVYDVGKAIMAGFSRRDFDPWLIPRSGSRVGFTLL